MAYIEWSENLSVKVEEIDEQHKKLITIINRLHEAMLANRAKQLQKEIIAEMVDYAVVHFATEEKYMCRYNFPGLAQHLLEHEQFAAEAADLKGRADRDGFILSLEILTFLKEWLQNHILGTDMKYSEHFLAQGSA